jgi:hypothetical protein
MKNIILLFLTFTFFNCQSQNQKEKKNTDLKDTLKPKTHIEVKKEYDEFGNLISVDSTYSYFYSNIKNDSVLEQKVFDQFKLNFNNQFEGIDSLFIKDFFEHSPFNINDFYTEDFLKKSFDRHQEKMEKLLKQTDALKNEYYKNQKELKKI